MKSAGLCATHLIVMDVDIARTLVGVDAPTAVVPGIDVFNHVVGDDGAARLTQMVDAAHVGEQSLSDVADMVIGDVVVHRRAFVARFVVAPLPAAGDAAVVEIIDVVAADDAVVCIEKDDAYGAGIDAAAPAYGVARHITQ